MDSVRIAVDAVGSDRGPADLVAGALDAGARFDDLEVLLVGPEDAVRPHLPAGTERVRHVPSGPAVGMDESPIEAIRRKKDSSISVAARLVGSGEADALVSAGNTGATVAATSLALRLLPGVRRPGIAVTLPTLSGFCTVIDVGANVACKPEDLLQYGLMGAGYTRDILGKPDPVVGLLNIGEEEGKGTVIVKTAGRLLAESGLHYGGHAEGRDIYLGRFDVVVCEGFVGNIVLKVSEGLAESLIRLLKRELTGTPRAKLGTWLAKGALMRFRDRVDYAQYGGAPLLGVNGHCIIAHGRSSPEAIRNAVRVARECVRTGLAGRLADRLRTEGAGTAGTVPATGAGASGDA